MRFGKCSPKQEHKTNRTA